MSLAHTGEATLGANATKILKFYVIMGCFLQFLVFHILQTAAHEITIRMTDSSPTQISALTTITLHMHPFLNVFNLALWVFVAYALIRKKSDIVLVHILGIILVSSLGTVVLQAAGAAIFLPGL